MAFTYIRTRSKSVTNDFEGTKSLSVPDILFCENKIYNTFTILFAFTIQDMFKTLQKKSFYAKYRFI